MNNELASHGGIDRGTLLLDIATRDVVCLAPENSVVQAARLMSQKRISSVVVTVDSRHPCGIVTERDILDVMQIRRSPETPLRKVMSTPLVTVPADITSIDAYQVCLRDGIRHLVIVDEDGILAGVASETDFRLHAHLGVLAGHRQVTSVMRRSTFSVAPGSSLQHALNDMHAHRNSCVVVADAEQAVGIVTERDVVRIYSNDPQQGAIAVSEIMTAPVWTVPLDATINEAAQKMLAASVRHLVVVDSSGRLAGVLDEHDLTQTLAIGLIDDKAVTQGAFLDTLIKTIPDLVWLRDLHGAYLACNPRFERFLGFKEKDLVGKTDHDILPAELADSFRRSDRVAIEENRQHIIEGWHTFAEDGHREYLETIKTPMRDSRGRMIGVLGIARDITQRKLADQARFESEERYRSLSENSPDVIVRYDLEGRRTYVNPEFERVNHMSAQEVLGKKPTELSTELKPKAAEFTEKLMAAMAAGTVTKIDLQWTVDGRPICWFVRVVPEFDAEGKVESALTIWSDITERKQAEKEIEQLAFYDPLTQLPNRRLLVDRLHQALVSSARNHRKGALLFIDLDNFKILNDTSGHDVGDQLLVEVARRLVACVRDGDTIARLGGDEFVVVLEDLSQGPQEAAAQTKIVGEKILTALNVPYSIAGSVHHSTPSIGVTLFAGSQHSVDELLKQADIAMYQAKSAGRNTLRFFDPEMQAALAARALMEAALRLGIQYQQFVLHYQPQVDDARGVIGAEALLRWHHPERGIVYPDQFIPLAEDTGLILPIGQWVLEAACSQLKQWATDSRTHNLKLSINVSARQFRQFDFVDRVKRALLGADAPAAHLQIELTESVVLENVEDTISKMQQLKKLGVGFAMDDFGTGYSSLSYLTRLPLDEIKIDRSFVCNLPGSANDAAVAQTIITLAKSLGLAVTAEGVETEEQRQFLEQHGCPIYQGYLFSRPVDIGQFERLLAHQ